MKRVLAMVLCACMSFTLLAGCGNSGKETAAETPAAAESAAAESTGEAESAKPEASGEKTVITYLRPGTEVDHNAELVQAINDKLDADGTGLELNIMYIPSDVFQDKLNMMLSSGEEFDLLCIMEDQKPFTSFIANE